MRRRELLLSLATAVMATRALRAQQKTMPVIGWLNPGSPITNPSDWVNGPIHQGLSEAGFVEGQNMTAEARWADFNYDRLPELAADLVSRKVDLIITTGGAPSALAAKNATSTIPIVFTDVGSPVESGFVAGLARPGGNLTGFTDIVNELIAKRLELLGELVPHAAAIALLVNPKNQIGTEYQVRPAQEAARARVHGSLS